MLRHVAFFEELGKLDESNPEWRSVAAGLVVMRLVDRWIQDGVVATDGWGANAVRESLAEIPATTPLQRILASIVDRIIDATRVDMRALSPRLMNSLKRNCSGPATSTIPFNGAPTATFATTLATSSAANGWKLTDGKRTVLPSVAESAMRCKNSKNCVARTIE